MSAGGEPLPVLMLIAAAGGNITVAPIGELSKDATVNTYELVRKWQDGGCFPPSLWLRTNIKEKQEPDSKPLAINGGWFVVIFYTKGEKARSPDVSMMLFRSRLRNDEE